MIWVTYIYYCHKFLLLYTPIMATFQTSVETIRLAYHRVFAHWVFLATLPPAHMLFTLLDFGGIIPASSQLSVKCTAYSVHTAHCTVCTPAFQAADLLDRPREHLTKILIFVVMYIFAYSNQQSGSLLKMDLRCVFGMFLYTTTQIQQHACKISLP